MKKTKQSPILWVPSVYFAMGLPYIMLSLVAPIFLQDMGIPDKSITFWTSLITLTWSFKPLLSIIMELFGTKRQYIILTEILSAVLFGLVVFSLPLPNFFPICLTLMWLIAFSGSMHDIAGDGVYMEQLDTSTQSIYSGWQGAFYNLAKVLANGGLVFLAGWLVRAQGFSVVESWQVIIGICAIILGLVGLYHIFAVPKDKHQKMTGTFSDKINNLIAIFADFFKKKYILYYLLFIIIYRLAEGLAMKVAPLFLKAGIEKGGIGLSNESYGLVYGTFGALAFIIGSIAAGYFVSHLGLKRSLFTLACAFNIPFVVYLIFAYIQPDNLWFISTGIVFEYFGYGFGFVGLTLFMMQQIAPGNYQMTHYAFANSLMNLGVAVPGMISGELSTLLGYKHFFLLVMICTIPALLMTWFVPFAHPDDKVKNS